MRAPLPLALALALALLSGCVVPVAHPPAGAIAFLPPVELANPPAGVYEPSLAVDGRGNVLVAGIRPFDAAPLWVSHDDGATFRRVGTTTGMPYGTEGQPAFSPEGDAYVVDDGLAGLFVARSRDHGDSWELRTPLALPLPAGDRPWVAAGAGGRFYVTWNQVPSGQWVAASADGGATFPVQTRVGDEFVVTGPLALGPDGALYLARDEAEGPALYLSRDGARTFERHLAWARAGEGNWWSPTTAVDEAGNVYVTTIEKLASGTRTRYAVSTDGGRTFGAPREATTQPGIHVHAWTAAGPRGKLAIAFYENPNGTGTPDDATGDWYLRLVLVDGADGDAPAAREARVLDAPVHKGNVCMHGTNGCRSVCPMGPGTCIAAVDESPGGHLGDYLGVAMESAGVVHVAFQDLTKGMSLWHVRTLGPAETSLSSGGQPEAWT